MEELPSVRLYGCFTASVKGLFTFSVRIGEGVTNQAHESWHLYVCIYGGALYRTGINAHIQTLLFFLLFFYKEGCA